MLFVLEIYTAVTEHFAFSVLAFFSYPLKYTCGPDTVVSVATGYGPDGPGIKSRWGARFSAPVQTGPGAHPASCTMGTRSFQGVKSGWGMTLTTHPLLVPRSKNRVELYLYSHYGPCTEPQCLYRVHFTFAFLKCT
jgi:hypothetical protein